MYAYYAGQGKDRGGMHYRLIAYDMLSRLQAKLEARFTTPGDVHQGNVSRYVKSTSRALWGVYCFERYEKFIKNGCPSVKLTLSQSIQHHIIGIFTIAKDQSASRSTVVLRKCHRSVRYGTKQQHQANAALRLRPQFNV
jgi:hypothetical protein